MDEEKILGYIYEAIEVEQKGLKIKPDKFAPLPVPQMPEWELNNDRALKEAFEKLSKGKHKEYILYIHEAKQEATKQNRIDKIKPHDFKWKGAK